MKYVDKTRCKLISDGDQLSHMAYAFENARSFTHELERSTFINSSQRNQMEAIIWYDFVGLHALLMQK